MWKWQPQQTIRYIEFGMREKKGQLCRSLHPPATDHNINFILEFGMRIKINNL